MGIEFELKYAAEPAQQAAVLAAFPGDWQTIAMETTYYDTVEGALSAKHYTLRRRMENGISVCTLKAPAGLARGEWEMECGSIEDAIPELCKLSGLALPCPVTAICGARFTRRALTLTLEACTVEIAVDAGTLLGGGTEVPLCEVEVELKSGSQEAAVAFARELAGKFRLKAEKKSKFRRALALAKGE